MRLRAAIVVLVLACACIGAVGARTVHRCVRDGTVSLSTAPEPGSKCEAKAIDDNAAMLPNLWGELGVFSGTLYEWRAPDGRTVSAARRYSFQNIFEEAAGGLKAYTSFWSDIEITGVY